MITNSNEAVKFQLWLKDTVKSIYYADVNSVLLACEKIKPKNE